MSVTKEYLGDAVYASYDNESGQICLTVEDGIHVTQCIYLDWEVMDKLMHFTGEFR